MVNFLFYVEREFHFYLFKNLIQYIQKHSLGRVAILSPPYQPSTIKSPNYGMRRELAGDLLWLDEQKLYRKLPACANHTRTASILLAENSYKQDACSTEDCQLAENSYKQDTCGTVSYKPDIVFIADSSYEKVEGMGFIVNIGHGVICKGSFFTDKPLSYRENCADLFCVPGVVHEKIMKKYLINSPLVTGMPKLDSVFMNTKTPEAAKRDLGLNPLKKTLLIAPTFNPEFSLINLIGADIRHFISDEYNIIFKLHGVSPMEQKELLHSLTVCHEDILLYNDYEIDDLFIVSDLMISDVSSIAFEFMALGKPVLLYNSPLMSKHPKYDLNDIEHQYRKTFQCFRTLSELPDLISRYISDTDYQKRMQTIGSRFIGIRDGSSSQLVVETAIKQLNQLNKRVLLISDSKETHLPVYCDCLISQDVMNTHIPSKYAYIIVKQGVKRETPNLIRYLYHALNRFQNTIVMPFSYEPDSGDLFIGKHIPETANMTFDQIQTALSYRYSGCYSETTGLNEKCFAFLNHGESYTVSDYLNSATELRQMKLIFEAMID